MIKVVNVIYHGSQFEVGCNNGNYEPVTLILSDGSKIETETCRCRNGCGGTACLYVRLEGEWCFITDLIFKDRKALEDFLFGEEE